MNPIHELYLAADLTVDAYERLLQTVCDILPHVHPDHYQQLAAAITESAMMLQLAASQ